MVARVVLAKNAHYLSSIVKFEHNLLLMSGITRLRALTMAMASR
jgi:hypothetical protein